VRSQDVRPSRRERYPSPTGKGSVNAWLTTGVSNPFSKDRQSFVCR